MLYMRHIIALITLLFLGFSSTHLTAKPLQRYLPGDITQSQAHPIIESAVNAAKAQNLLMNIAIVDAGGNLKAFTRMDGALLASINIAIKKAITAHSLNMSTYTLSQLAQPGQPLYGIEIANGGTILFGGGELLINHDGIIVGAIGVSGGSVEEDMLVASTGVAWLNQSSSD